MFARVTRYKFKTDKLGEVDAVLDRARAKLSRIAGLVSTSTMRNDDGVGMTVALYTDAAAAEAAAQQIKDVWADFGDFVAAPLEVQTFSTVHKLAG